jgi:uridine kinase
VPDQLERSWRAVLNAVSEWRTDHTLLVAIDGHGAAGKSSIAAELAVQAGAALVHTDDFFRPAGSPGIDGVPMSRYYDWERLRREALEPLLGGRTANFRAFDWESDSFLPGSVSVEPAAVVVLEGVSASAEALAPLVARKVLVVTPEAQRLQRLRERLTDDVWDADWLAEERAYFGAHPADAFDLVVSGAATP